MSVLSPRGSAQPLRESSEGLDFPSVRNLKGALHFLWRQGSLLPEELPAVRAECAASCWRGGAAATCHCHAVAGAACVVATHTSESADQQLARL
jgi:hypothetical protein